jgi:hypothetical protein
MGRPTKSISFLTLIAAAHAVILWIIMMPDHTREPAVPPKVILIKFSSSLSPSQTGTSPRSKPRISTRSDARISKKTAAPVIKTIPLVKEPPAPPHDSRPPTLANLSISTAEFSEKIIQPADLSVLERAKAEVRKMKFEDGLGVHNDGHSFARQDRLAAGIAAAYRVHTTSFVELRRNDGSPITKVIGPMGTYCVARDSNAITGGRDPFRDGVRDRIVSCPR